MQTNNALFKEICEAYGITIDSGTHTNNYYLNKIATEKFHKTYTETTCNGKYLKDIAEDLGSTTYSSHHFNNFYLKEICSALTGADYNTEFDNYYLSVWKGAIEALKTPTVLTLETPMLVYTDEFDVSGVLKDNANNPISNASVRLVWNDGSEHSESLTTGSDGKVTFHSSEPASVSQYSFQMFYDGNATYKQTNSSLINVDTAKETSVVNITSPATGSSVFTDSVTITGTLKDDDGTAMVDETLVFSVNGLRFGQYTIQNDGSFTETITGLVEGENVIDVYFLTTDTHTFSRQPLTVNYVTFDDFSISADSILSYADGDTTDVTVQLLADGAIVPRSGVSVTIYKDEEVWYTANTDSSGKVSKTYTSEGVGDVVFTAEVSGMSLTKTYTVHDYLRYDTASSDKTSSYGSSIGLRNSGTGSITYDNNGYYILKPTTANSESFIPLNELTGLNDIVIEFDGYLPQSASVIGGVIYSDSNNWIRMSSKYNDPCTIGKSINGTFNETTLSSQTPPTQVWRHFKCTITNNTFKIEQYNGSTLELTITENVDSTWFNNNTKYGFTILWSTNWNCRIKNIVVKPL